MRVRGIIKLFINRKSEAIIQMADKLAEFISVIVMFACMKSSISCSAGSGRKLHMCTIIIENLLYMLVLKPGARTDIFIGH